ncbi:thialysine N-epsilon-acetyltransferase isoform X1 [Sceloporus undulatus]|uniref:thialysine N-epsilon-acetyltransferase isoform X1 n=1 Tax=Sceloporus undulatus TaxID=8520 RepID=UPI001C4D5287|nr:thialysine N-epsilon-acetyltransferase isoform X1 [Sceloporus undulatus]
MLGDVVLLLPGQGQGKRRRMEPPGASIRACRPEDCAQVLRLVRELAEYEKTPEQVKISDQELCQDGFGQDAFYKCLVAEVPPEHQSKAGHTIIGYALYFFTYSTWKGRNIYMEDLYVMPEFRGKGIGKKLMRTIAEIGLEKGCTQMKFSVLDWNQPAMDFYFSKGAVDLTATEGWHVFRFEADAMRRMARGKEGK